MVLDQGLTEDLGSLTAGEKEMTNGVLDTSHLINYTERIPSSQSFQTAHLFEDSSYLPS